MFLTDDDLTELTKRKHNRARRAVLDFMGIEYSVRPDSSIAVLKDHVVQKLGGDPARQKQAAEPEPNWAAI